MREPRADRWNPARVPDIDPGPHPGTPRPTDVPGAFDTDADGRPDTVVGVEDIDLVLHTDLDGDGLADQILRIGPDGVVRHTLPSTHHPAGEPSDDPTPAVPDPCDP